MTDEQLAELEALAAEVNDGLWKSGAVRRLANAAIPSLIAEVKRLRAVVSDRASVIEECAAIADLVCKANFMERGGLLVDKIVPRIRALATQQEKDHG